MLVAQVSIVKTYWYEAGLPALIEYTFNTFLQPFAVRVLTMHEQLDCPFNGIFVWVLRFEKCDDNLQAVSHRSSSEGN